MMEISRQHPTIHVVAAVLHDAQGQVLIGERPAGKPLAGFWEFPGGKLEAGETARAALSRELHEELGITVQEACPLIRFAHDYPERHVELDVWRVLRYAGQVQARERQALAWVNPGALADWKLLPADAPIARILRLPPRMLVTPDSGVDEAAFLDQLNRRLVSGIDFVQLRESSLDPDRYRELARRVIGFCHARGARVILNADASLAEQLGADGVQLASHRLLNMTQRPAAASFLIGASCHDAAQLKHAESCGLDYIVLGPVLPTATHPGARVLGWEGFARLAGISRLPVYAIGGMRAGDLERIRVSGGYGVAAIRGLWGDESVAG
ncbi:MAG TPA: Nudix family hydrolase [Gammaproteobacteria bacterium]|nr:Nudix family hydrolase [Gammaproteobacteria bacterium]